MKIAIVGLQTIHIQNIERYLPRHVTELVTADESGIEISTQEYARARGLLVTKFPTEYEEYGSMAPDRRNIKMVDYADAVIAFWDGKSTETKSVIDRCAQSHKKLSLYMVAGQA